MDAVALTLGIAMRVAAPALMLAAILYAWRATRSPRVLILGLAAFSVPPVLDLGTGWVVDAIEREQATPGGLSIGTIVMLLSYAERMVTVLLLAALIWVATTAVLTARPARNIEASR